MFQGLPAPIFERKELIGDGRGDEVCRPPASTEIRQACPRRLEGGGLVWSFLWRPASALALPMRGDPDSPVLLPMRGEPDSPVLLPMRGDPDSPVLLPMREPDSATLTLPVARPTIRRPCRLRSWRCRGA